MVGCSPHFVNAGLEKLSQHILRTTDTHAILFCPFCNDKTKHMDSGDGHLGIEIRPIATGYWNCFLCNRGNKDFSILLSAYGIELSYLDRLQSIPSFSPTAESVKVEETNEKQERAIADFEAKSFPVPESSDAFLYLTRRRKLPEAVVAESWRMWNQNPYYVFWHCRDKNGKVVFYSGRSFLKNFLGPKYLHSTTSTPLLKVNLNKTMKSPNFGVNKNMIFLVEGIFDALGAPSISIPLFGKKLANRHTKSLVKILQEGNYAPICALDADAITENLKLAQTLTDYGIPEIYIFSWTKKMKDFGERQMADVELTELKSFLHPYHPHTQKMLEGILRRQL